MLKKLKLMLCFIVNFVIGKKKKRATGASADYSDKGLTELDTMIYDTPYAVRKEHTITTQDNIAYGGTIPLKHNEAYQQVHIK